MVSALVYKIERSGFEPWPGLFCCVLGQDLSTQVYKWVPANIMLGDNPAIDWHPIQEGVEKIRDTLGPERPLGSMQTQPGCLLHVKSYANEAKCKQ